MILLFSIFFLEVIVPLEPSFDHELARKPCSGQCTLSTVLRVGISVNVVALCNASRESVPTLAKGDRYKALRVFCSHESFLLVLEILAEIFAVLCWWEGVSDTESGEK